MSAPARVRLGAVGYLNARPLVYGLDAAPRFDLRYDVPSECARLLHDGSIDVESKPGGGATFIVRLPKRTPNPAARAEASR